MSNQTFTAVKPQVLIAGHCYRYVNSSATERIEAAVRIVNAGGLHCEVVIEEIISVNPNLSVFYSKGDAKRIPTDDIWYFCSLATAVATAQQALTGPPGADWNLQPPAAAYFQAIRSGQSETVAIIKALSMGAMDDRPL